jgi:simple sugar transport system permease protein
MAPYVVTILTLVILSAGRGARGAPGSLGKPFHASA